MSNQASFPANNTAVKGAMLPAVAPRRGIVLALPAANSPLARGSSRGRPRGGGSGRGGSSGGKNKSGGHGGATIPGPARGGANSSRGGSSGGGSNTSGGHGGATDPARGANSGPGGTAGNSDGSRGSGRRRKRDPVPKGEQIHHLLKEKAREEITTYLATTGSAVALQGSQEEIKGEQAAALPAQRVHSSNSSAIVSQGESTKTVETVLNIPTQEAGDSVQADPSIETATADVTNKATLLRKFPEHTN